MSRRSLIIRTQIRVLLQYVQWMRSLHSRSESDVSDPVSEVSLARIGDCGPLSSEVVFVFLGVDSDFPLAPAFEYFLL